MATTRLARPVKTPVRATRVTAKKVAKKTLPKKAMPKKALPNKAAKKAVKKIVKKVAKKTATTKATSATKSATLSPEKIRASVAARKRTVAATQKRIGETAPIIVDDNDESALEKLGRTRRRTATDKAADLPPATGKVLIERVVGLVEQELLQIETIVSGKRVDPGRRTEAERRARTLATLAHTLSTVKRLRDADQPQRPQPQRLADDAGRPRDLDEFRRTLWGRLEKIASSTPPGSVRNDDGG